MAGINRFNPQFQDPEGGVNFTVVRKVPPTTNTTYYQPTDVYETPALAEDRSFNIGCTGYRNVVINATGTVRYAPCIAASTYTVIIKGMPKINAPREYYAFDPTDNIDDVKYSINDDLYSGYDYKERIFEKTMSKVILRDPVKASILVFFQRVVFALIESTKQITNFVNYTVKKNNKRVF